MNSIFERLVIFFNLWWCGLAYLMIVTSKDQKEIIFHDIDRWSFRSKRQKNRFLNMSYLLSFCKEYRNLLCYRLKAQSKIKSLLFILFFKRVETLYLDTPKIGKGLIIQHGFATIVSAKEIGDDCWINQQLLLVTAERMHRLSNTGLKYMREQSLSVV